MSHWNTCRGGGGLVISEFNFYFDDPISNPVKVYSSSVKMLLEKNENTQKEVGDGPFKKHSTKAQEHSHLCAEMQIVDVVDTNANQFDLSF